MCTGVELAMLAASAAATAGGTAAQISGAQKTRSASEAAAQQNLQHQKDLNDQAQAIFQQQMAKSNVTDASADVDKQTADQMAQTQALLNRPQPTDQYGVGTYAVPSPTATPANSTPIIKDLAAKSLADELARVQGQMQGAATLQGMRQNTIQRGYDFGHAGELMQNVGNAQTGWNQVNQAQQQLAQSAGMGDKMLGDALVGLGSIGAQAYGAGLGKAGSLAGTAGSGAYGVYGTAPEFSSITPAAKAGLSGVFL